jgi:hypothetical protein
MSSSIGYGAAAIRAGDAKYQQSLVNLLKDAAKQPDEAKTQHADEAKPEPPAPKPADHVGKKLDVTA